MSVTAEITPALDLHVFRAKARELAKAREEARRDYERYCAQEADAERDYRKRLAIAFANARSREGTTAGQAEVEAHAEAADNRHRRDIAHSLAKSALLRIEEIEANRAMLRTDFDSGRREGLAA